MVDPQKACFTAIEEPILPTMFKPLLSLEFAVDPDCDFILTMYSPATTALSARANVHGNSDDTNKLVEIKIDRTNVHPIDDCVDYVVSIGDMGSRLKLADRFSQNSSTLFCKVRLFDCSIYKTVSG